jgi:hypothetical protein
MNVRTTFAGEIFVCSMVMVVIFFNNLSFVYSAGTTTTSFHHYNATITRVPFFIKEDTPPFSITIAKGKWHYDKWGQPWDPAPDGVHVYLPKPSEELYHLIGYLTGSSLALLDTKNTISIFDNATSRGNHDNDWDESGVENNITHGFLPREAFCTENLMTLVKFLPHRTLPMDTIKYFNSLYHSYRIQRRKGENTLILTITMVIDNDPSIHFFEKANKDFSYIHKIIDHKEGINELPKQYLNIERSTIGWGQVDGQFIVKLTNLHSSRPIEIQKYHDISPYFLAIDFKTLVIDPFMWMSYDHVEFSEAVGSMKTPNRLTLKNISIPPLNTVTFRIYFKKLFLHVDDFPPDADHGLEVFCSWASTKLEGNDDDDWSIVYGDGLLVVMPKPDFSMPFNVITLTSTVLAFLFGSVFNMLVRKKGKKKSDKKKENDSNSMKQEGSGNNDHDKVKDK